jgi:DNA-binding SARP family transcriptional activator
MADLSIRLFGRFSVQRGDHRVEGLGSLKAQELLSYLLINRGHPHSREILASVLWGDCTTAQSRKHLRQSLWQLQSALNLEPESPVGHVLIAEADWVDINCSSEFWLDVGAFEQAFISVQRVPGRQLNEESARSLERALRLYRGDLMEGSYQDWCLCERERLQNIYLMMLDKLMAYSEAAGDYESSLDYGARILARDRAREHIHCRLMRIYYFVGDRTSAIRQYQRCAAALDEELGVTPANSTTALLEQICEDRSHLSDVDPSSIIADDLTERSLAESLLSLKRLHAYLSDVQDTVLRGIGQVEAAIKNRK